MRQGGRTALVVVACVVTLLALGVSGGSWAADTELETGWPGCESSYADRVLDDSPLAYWRLGETAGATAVDASGSGTNGVYGGGPALGAPGAIARDPDPAVGFDGNDDRLTARPAFPSSEISIEIWLRTTDVGPATIFSYATSADDNTLQLSNPASLVIRRGSTRAIDTGVSVNNGAWHHLVVSWRSSDGETSIYEDGERAFAGTLAQGTSMQGGGAVALAQDQDTVGGGFEPGQALAGEMDDVALYGSALRTIDVNAHYAAGRDTLAGWCDVLQPAPPREYELPPGAVSVSTSEGLVSALAGASARDIILSNGEYTTAGTESSTPYFFADAPHRLYSRTLGGAVLHAGLVFGGNSGPGGGEAHGLAFDIRDRARSWDGNALGSWGAGGVATKVYDSTFEGHYALDTGIELRQVQDAVVQRVVVRHFRRQGVFVSDCCDDDWYDNTAQASRITDLDVEGVREVVPGSSRGRAEYGVWIGNGVRNRVTRLRIEHAWWSGLWVGSSSHDTLFRNITITTVDRPGGNAVYNEHKTTRDTFERFSLGPDIGEGFVCEWNYGSGAGACNDSVFQDGTIASRKAGVYLDKGQVGNSVRRVRFLGQTCAGIVDNDGIGNTHFENDFSLIAASALTVLRGSC